MPYCAADSHRECHTSRAKLRPTIIVKVGASSCLTNSALTRPKRLCAQVCAANTRGWKSSGQPLASTVAARGPDMLQATRLADTSNSAPRTTFSTSRFAPKSTSGDAPPRDQQPRRRTEPERGQRVRVRCGVRNQRQRDSEQTLHRIDERSARSVALHVPRGGNGRLGERDAGAVGPVMPRLCPIRSRVALRHAIVLPSDR